MTGTQVRRAETDDLTVMGEQATSYLQYLRSLDARWGLAENVPLRWAQHAGKKLSEQAGVFFFAESHGRAAGLAEADVYEQGAWFEVPRYGYLRNLIVAPDYRKRGIGKQLLEAVLSELKSRSVQSARVRCSVKLPESIECWRRRDFHPAYHEVLVSLRPTSPISAGRAARKMQAADLDVCSRLYEAFVLHENDLGAPWRLVPGWQNAWIQRMKARISLPETAAYVIEAEGRPAGMALGSIVNQPPYLSPPRYARIEYVVVADAYRKRGLGHALAQRLLSHCQTTARIMEIHAQFWHADTVARSFWRKEEFDELAVWLVRRLPAAF